MEHNFDVMKNSKPLHLTEVGKATRLLTSQHSKSSSCLHGDVKPKVIGSNGALVQNNVLIYNVVNSVAIP